MPSRPGFRQRAVFLAIPKPFHRMEAPRSPGTLETGAEMTEKKATRQESADEGPFRTEITKQEINALELHRYTGPVDVVTDDATLARAVRRLRREKVLGFDTETRPSFHKGQSYLPSLVQLCGAERVYIFQLVCLPSKRRLFNLLGDARIRKVGVAMDYDIRQLCEIHPFKPAGFVNLESLTDEFGIRNNGLRGLAAVVLGFRISKGEQRSNWSRTDLTKRQITYAATDAWASREIYLRLVEELRRRRNGDKGRPKGEKA